MTYLARDRDGVLNVYDSKPRRDTHYGEWCLEVEADYCFECNMVRLPSDSDARLIGRHLSWEDEPVELL